MTVLLDVIRTSTRLRPATAATYTISVGQFLAFAGKNPLTGALVEAWRDRRLAQGTNPNTVHKGMAAIKLASRRAFTLGLIPTDFAEAAEFPPRKPWKPHAALSEAEFLAMEAACRNDATPPGLRDLALIDIPGRACGARPPARRLRPRQSRSLLLARYWLP